MTFCSRGDDVQRSIELLDKVLSEYDEHGSNEEPGDELGEVEEGSSASGVGEAVDEADADADGQVGGRDSSTEPSIGLTPEDESPSLGTVFKHTLYYSPFNSQLDCLFGSAPSILGSMFC